VPSCRQPVAEGVTNVNIGFNNLEYSYFLVRTEVKADTTVTLTNVGDIPHTATELKSAEWDTGVLDKDQSKAITFSEPGSYYYICHPR
jgi:plastocyanin